jgi:hypothetical protein
MSLLLKSIFFIALICLAKGINLIYTINIITIKNIFLLNKYLHKKINWIGDWTSVTVKNNGGYVARFEVRYKLDDVYKSEITDKFPGKVLNIIYFYIIIIIIIK